MFKNGLPATTSARKSPKYDRQKLEWEMINVLLGGTGEIRKHTKYLPQHKNESNDQYKMRLSKAVLAPFFKRTVNFATGKAFYKAVQINPAEEFEIDDELQAVINDADRKNNSLNTFANLSFRDSWAKGMGFIYVEAPAYDPAQIKNEEQRRKLDIRPYLVYVEPEKLLDVVTDGNGKIIYAKMLEAFTEFDPQRQATVENTRIRIVTPDWIGIYERDATIASSEAGGYTMKQDPMENRIGVVPLVPIYTGELKTDFECVSALIDLAYTNVQYYQDESTHETAISAAEFPILCLKGGKGADTNVGPFKMISISDPAGDLKYVEHSGAALEAGRKNLEELRVKLAYCGLKSLTTDSGRGRTVTATEAKLDSIDSNSDLKVATDNYADALAMALWYAQRYMGKVAAEDQLNLSVKIDGMFSITSDDVKELAALMELEEKGSIRLQTLFKELKRRNVFSDDFDIQSEVDFAAENSDLSGRIEPLE